MLPKGEDIVKATQMWVGSELKARSGDHDEKTPQLLGHVYSMVKGKWEKVINNSETITIINFNLAREILRKSRSL